jgi:hypothetical protein
MLVSACVGDYRAKTIVKILALDFSNSAANFSTVGLLFDKMLVFMKCMLISAL